MDILERYVKGLRDLHAYFNIHGVFWNSDTFVVIRHFNPYYIKGYNSVDCVVIGKHFDSYRALFTSMCSG